MTNRVHLLLTPKCPGDVSRLMQTLGRVLRPLRQRSLLPHWHLVGRGFKSSLVNGDDYLLRCQRYIELNPLRARMVVDPDDYLWSSHRGTASAHRDALLTPHTGWHALGETDALRRDRWRQLVLDAVTPEETEAIQLHLQRQHLYGPDRFRRTIEAQLGRTLGPGKPGRPRAVRAHESEPQEQNEIPL